MMPQVNVSARLARLARRLAPRVIEDAIGEARERARLQLVDRLTEELTEEIVAAVQELADWPETGGRERGRAEAEPGGRELARREPGRPGPGARQNVPAEAGCRGDRGLYVYGVVDAGLDMGGVRGVDGQAEVRAISGDSVALAVSDIDLGLLSGLDSDVDENLVDENPSESMRLATLAQHHDRVLRELLERGGGVLPLRFGTVLPTAADAHRVLADAYDELHQELDDMRGRHEWGLRADLVAPAGAAAEEPAAVGHSGRRGAPVPSSGTAYLTRRRDQVRAEAEQRERSAEAVAKADAELAALSEDTAPSPPARSAGPANRIFDCAYLVAVGKERDFLDAVARATDELERAGCAATLTGPWPPYSFVHLTLGSGGDDA
jgi:hypothetical protein